MGSRESKQPRADQAELAKTPAAPAARVGHSRNGTSNGHSTPIQDGVVPNGLPSTVSAPPLVAPAAPPTDPRVSALALVPHGHFVLTAAFGDFRGGVVVRWVQQVSSAPLLVVVAIEKGQPLSPLIRDSRRFALCQIPADDRVLRKIFEPEREDLTDPFLGLSTIKAPSGAPVPTRAAAWLDCELTRHLDVEGNCELYVGLVHAGGVLPPRPPVVVAPVRPPEPRTRSGSPRRR